jgi:SAM-dependent methyltransferase
MRHFWDRAARDDAELAIDDRGRRGKAFWLGGEEVVAVFEAELGFAVGGRTVVEIGCGIGRITRILADRCERVVAIDVSPEMLARARTEHPALENVEWLLGDGETLAGVPDASADGVFSHVVFQHIPDPAITLGYVAEMGRVLRPGGWAAFQVSNDPELHARAADHDPAWRGSAVDLDELRTAAQDAGLRVERIVREDTPWCLVRLTRTSAERSFDAPIGA